MKRGKILLVIPVATATVVTNTASIVRRTNPNTKSVASESLSVRRTAEIILNPCRDSNRFSVLGHCLVPEQCRIGDILNQKQRDIRTSSIPTYKKWRRGFVKIVVMPEHIHLPELQGENLLILFDIVSASCA